MQITRVGKWSQRKILKNALRPTRILVVDDHHDVAEATSVFLSMAGFEAVSISNPNQATRAAELQGPDIVLLDINMPGTNGFNIANAMRALTSTREVVLIAYTSEAWASIEDQAVTSGFDGYFRKATDPMELVSLLATYETLGCVCEGADLR